MLSILEKLKANKLIMSFDLGDGNGKVTMETLKPQILKYNEQKAKKNFDKTIKHFDRFIKRLTLENFPAARLKIVGNLPPYYHEQLLTIYKKRGINIRRCSEK